MNIKLISKLAAVLFAGAAFSCFNSSTLAMEGKGNNKFVGVDKYKNYLDLERNFFRKDKSYFHNNLKKLNVLDYSSEYVLEKRADDAYIKVKNFIEKINDYQKQIGHKLNKMELYAFIQNFVSTNRVNDEKKIQVQNADWFRNHGNDPDYAILYTGVPTKEVAENLRKGVPPEHDKPWTNLMVSPNAIYTNMFIKGSYDILKEESPYGDPYNVNSEKRDGEIVKLAVRNSAQIISSEYLNMIFSRIVEKYGANDEKLGKLYVLRKGEPGDYYYDAREVDGFINNCYFYDESLVWFLCHEYQALFAKIIGFDGYSSYRGFPEYDLTNEVVRKEIIKGINEILNKSNNEGIRDKIKKLHEKIVKKYGSEFTIRDYVRDEKNPEPPGYVSFADFSNLIVCSDEFDVDEDILNFKWSV